jgi:hypothetical protein
MALFAMPVLANPVGNTARAGFSGLPLRGSPSTYGAVVKELPSGQQLTILWNEYPWGWSYVEVAGTGQKGWVCNQNVY